MSAQRAQPATVTVGTRTIKLSRRDKVLFPDDGITKGDLIDYYHRIAPRMVPYLAGRPTILQRFPNGIREKGFIQQNASPHFPDWIERVTVPKENGETRHVVCSDEATLVYLANQGCITLHVWLSRVDQLHCPDRVILDLDPPGDDFEPVREGARAAGELLRTLGLTPYVMTTGSSGLHVLAPLPPEEDFDAVRAFAREAAEVLAGRHPEIFTTEQRKEKRAGRVFLDTLRNTYAHTAVPPYAVRALPGAPVAVPIHWDELDDPALHARRYTIRTLFERLRDVPDPWADLDAHARSLAEPQQRLAALASA